MNDNKIVQVKQIMTDNFAIVDGLATVARGLGMMKDKDVRALIIDKRNSNDEFGIVLLSDMAKKVLAQGRSPGRVNLYEIMSKPVISVEPDLNIRYCARLFHNFGLAIAPVIHNGEILGIVSYHEIVLDGLVKLLDESSETTE